MSLRYGAGAHAGSFWISVSKRRRHRNGSGRHPITTFWSWLVLTAVVMTVIHVDWLAYLAAGILVAVASVSGNSRRPRQPGRHR